MSLDDDLAAWADAVRLSDAEAAAISERITATSAPVEAGPVLPLAPSWWREYTADFTRRMVASTRRAPRAA
jgi:hypothetical protein